MAPRAAALLPLLTVLGTTAAAAVLAQKFIPQYMANKHNKNKNKTKKTTQQPTDTQQPLHSKDTTMKPTATGASTTTTAKSSGPPVPLTPPPTTPHASTIVAILLQDSYLLVSAFGACIMVVAVLVSLALVAVRDDVASLNDLQMFPPLMLVAMGMISLGMVLSMLNPKPPLVVQADEEMETEKELLNEKKTTTTSSSSEDGEAIKKAAQQGQGFLYEYYKNKYGQQTETEEDEEEEEEKDDQPKKRVSRCPFGFM